MRTLCVSHLTHGHTERGTVGGEVVGTYHEYRIESYQVADGVLTFVYLDRSGKRGTYVISLQALLWFVVEES